MQFGKSRELKKTKVEIIPMIDTMFFLLVFFILSSVGVIKLQGIDINLPKAEASNTPKTDKPPIDLTISISKEQVISVNAIKMRPRQDIGPTLKREYQRQAPNAPLTDASVVISADESVPHGTVVRCIDEARSVQINKFAIATQPEGGAPAAATPPGPSGKKRRR